VRTVKRRRRLLLLSALLAVIAIHLPAADSFTSWVARPVSISTESC
jgi:hypothetical protein